MTNLETLFKKSNALLFEEPLIDSPDMRNLIVSRLNLARSIYLTDSTNTEFDKLISSLEYSLERSDDLMALSLIKKVNVTLVSIAESFDNILTLSNKNF